MPYPALYLRCCIITTHLSLYLRCCIITAHLSLQLKDIVLIATCLTVFMSLTAFITNDVLESGFPSVNKYIPRTSGSLRAIWNNIDNHIYTEYSSSSWIG